MSQIEYFDPDGVFAVVQAQLQDRLPLRNLHWKSPARPVRSIASLQVDFVKAPDTGAVEVVPNGRNSLSILGKGAAQFHPKPQRHQIPGLRTSPYLKLLLLRCDDKETYKASTRQFVREWLRDNAAAKTNQDNHDAFEWLIVHVVFPDTPAAHETRWSRSSGSGDDTPKQKSSGASRWPGRSSGTILEKLKSDFNHSSKSAPDRVTQVKLLKGEDTSSHASAILSDDGDDKLSDLLAKLRSLLLKSFGLRVAQYEEDVRQKDLQRALPGWNFCTFFVLKEGLGLAFESVGLIEDSLVIYDELAAGLDAAVSEGSQRTISEGASDFIPFSPELKQMLGDCLNTDKSGETSSIPSIQHLDVNVKPYRDLIVANKISLFDIKTYIFVRQMALLLRLAVLPTGANVSQDDSFSHQESDGSIKHYDKIGEVQDPLALSLLCQRASSFLASTGRLMRHELFASIDDDWRSAFDEVTLTRVCSRIVLSWSFAVAYQVISETSSPSFPGLPGSAAVSGAIRVDAYPSRRSSTLTSGHVSENMSTTTAKKHNLFDLINDMSLFRPLQNAEMANAACHRAEIYLLQRKILEKASVSCGQNLNWPKLVADDRQDTMINQKTAEHEGDFQAEAEKSLKGFTDPQLKLALSTVASAKDQFQILSDNAAWNYTIAGHHKSAQRLHADVAVLRFHDRDYAAAAVYFNRLTNIYSQAGWTMVESRLLLMHAECLKALNRRDDHLRILTNLLAKSRAEQQKRKHRGTNAMIEKTSEESNFTNLMSEAISASRALSYDFHIPLMTYFDHLDIDQYISLLDDQDGFGMSVSLNQTMIENLHIDQVKIQLFSHNGSFNKDIWLEGGPIVLEKKTQNVWLQSNVSAFGIYVVAKVIVNCGRLAFTHDYLTHSNDGSSLVKSSAPAEISADPEHQISVQCFPRRGAFKVSAFNSDVVWLGKPRSLWIKIESGLNHVESGSMSIRANTAGLRIFVANATCDKDKASIRSSSRPGTFEFDKLEQQTTLLVVVPWSLEQNLPRISIRLEAEYTVASKKFIALSTEEIDVNPAIDVSVQDLFKEQALVSQFLMRPAKASPAYIFNVQLGSSSTYNTVPADTASLPLIAFSNESVCMTYKIYKASGQAPSSADVALQMPLTIEYRLVRQDVLHQTIEILLRDLSNSSLLSFTELISSCFARALSELMTDEMLETAALMAQFQLPEYEAFSWKTHLLGLSLDGSNALVDWLMHWHDEHEVIHLRTPFDSNYLGNATVSRLGIDFEVPKVDFLHTTSLTLDSNIVLSSKDNPRPPVVVAGEPLAATITVRYTCIWSGGSNSNVARTARFEYDIVTDPNIWLIIGQRRAAFEAGEHEPFTQRVLLVALLPGYHALPAVEVRLVSDTEPAALSKLICETDCTTQNAEVLVIEGLRGSTVGVGQQISGKGELQELYFGALTLLESDSA